MPSRGTSGLLSRLKPAEQDPLEAVGLPSKGDKKLLDLRAQETYFTRIIERFLTLCTIAGQREELRRIFSSLEFAAEAQLSVGKSTDGSPAPAGNKDLSGVLMALRKLREGVVASKRADHFAVQVYLLSIRTSIMAKQPETYHPAILHLLRRIHPQHPLTSCELQDVAGYLVLDAACRRGQLAEAFEIRQQYLVKDAKINRALKAMVHDNYVVFERIRTSIDGHNARIMEYAQKEVRTQALKCFGTTYLSVDLDFLQGTMDSTWDQLIQKDGVGWELDGERVTIRKIKAR